MRILLVYPYFTDKRIDEQDIIAPPTGLYYVGAMLKKHGCRVNILNLNSPEISMPVIKKKLSDIKPDIIGFSIVHANRWGAIDVAGLAREAVPSAAIVFGGVGAAFLWKFLLSRFKRIDYVIVGEGERLFSSSAGPLHPRDPPARWRPMKY